MHLRLLGRASALAVYQTAQVAEALRRRWPDLDVTTLTRSSLGDRKPAATLWTPEETGVFTAELSAALVSGDADVVVHSWKDLPLASFPGTLVVATLRRADPRDVLVVRKEVAGTRPVSITILSSSPRRAWQLETSLAPLLPWPLSRIHTKPIRGNVPTRLEKLVSGEGDGLVVAKAALDRLLSDDGDARARATVRASLDACRWMVLPLREFPTAPAQGALAVEVSAARPDIADLARAINDEPTWSAVTRERTILSSFGGGCRDAVGATVLPRDYGVVTSIGAALPGESDRREWRLDTSMPPPPRTTATAMWPRPDERDHVVRRPLNVAVPPGTRALWATRAEAMPTDWPRGSDGLLWAAGSRTWRRLAGEGFWVNGCADGLGDAEAPDTDRLAGRPLDWLRLTHTASGAGSGLATYAVDRRLPADLGERTHFYWPSASVFLAALEAFPAIRSGWHASGPGRTFRTIRGTLGSEGRVSVWLDYEQWRHAVSL
jgi:hydroxymethylbilane synthase